MNEPMPDSVFIAGPIGGPGLNFENFYRVAANVRAQGHIVFNPAEKPLPFELRTAMAGLLHAERVIVLDRWWESETAQALVAVALILHMPVLDENMGDVTDEATLRSWVHQGGLERLLAVAPGLELP